MKKKNKTMRAAGALFVATMLTTSMTAGTFAKYTTGDSASDSARVAKFGVTVAASGNLFSNAYDAGNATSANTPAAVYSENHMTVASATESDDVVAPGTKSTANGFAFKISGKPEVAVTVGTTIKARDIFLKGGSTYAVMVKVDNVTRDNFAGLKGSGNLYVLNSGTYTKVTTADFSSTSQYYKAQSVITVTDAYYPVVYKLEGGISYTEGDYTIDSANQVAAVLAKAVNNGTAVSSTQNSTTSELTYAVAESTTTAGKNVYAPNKDLATEGPKLNNEVITWEWKYTTGEDNDKKDTILGDMIAASADPVAVGYTVVYGDDVNSMKAVVYDDINKIVKKDDETILASLKTSFDIEISVTQVD